MLFLACFPAFEMPPDVPETEPAYAQVKLLSERGLLHTYSDGLFRGARPVSRYEFVWMCDQAFRGMELLDLSMKKAEIPPDVHDNVSSTSPAYPPELNEAIRRMSGRRILQVYADGLFRSPRPASKNELAVTAYRLAKKTVKWDTASAASAPIPEPDGKARADASLDAEELNLALHNLAFLHALPFMPDGQFHGERPASRYEATIVLGTLVKLSKP